MSVFDSEEEDDNEAADELAREFSVLKIWIMNIHIWLKNIIYEWAVKRWSNTLL